MNTLNLSVDNALTSQQIIHQLITKLNELIEYVNDLNVNFIADANRYTDSKVSELSAKTSKDISNLDSKLQSDIKKVTDDLKSLSKETTKLTEDAIKHSREYTDINVEELNKKIKEITANIEDALKQSMLYTDDNIKVVNHEIELLYNHLEELAKNSFASVSMLDGSIKKNTDCFYDMLHVFQRGHTPTLDQFISMATYFIPSNNPNDKALLPTNIDTLLETCNEDYWTDYRVGTSFKFESTARKNIQSSWTNVDFTSNLVESRYPNVIPPRWGNIVSQGMHALGLLHTKGEDPMTGEPFTTVLMDKLELVQSRTINLQTTTMDRPSVFDPYSEFYQLM